MKLSVHSRNQLLTTFEVWAVPQDFAEPMYNYLVFGFNPGSFFTSVLANDFAKAIQHSHVANTMTALKALTGWIQSDMPPIARGSYRAVDDWRDRTEAQRRSILETYRLVYSVEDEMMLALAGKPTQEPVLW